MRPRGEIRAALADAVERLVRDRGFMVDGQACDGVPWREAAAAAQVGFEAAQHTIENMVRAGELQRIGSIKRAGSRHYEGLYAPASLEALPQPWGGIEALANAVATWPSAPANEPD